MKGTSCMSQKEKEREKALAPKEKTVIMDKTPMYYFSAKYTRSKSQSYAGSIYSQNYRKEILVLLCTVIGKNVSFGSEFSHLTESS